MIEFIVPIRPVGKERPRTVRVKNKSVTYTPARTKAYESILGQYALMARNRANIKLPLAQKVCVRAEFNFKKGKGKIPDVDNLIKSILDGMNGIIYEDDRQVVSVSAHIICHDNSQDVVFIQVY